MFIVNATKSTECVKMFLNTQLTSESSESTILIFFSFVRCLNRGASLSPPASPTDRSPSIVVVVAPSATSDFAYNKEYGI